MSWKDLFPKQNRYFETENGILYHSDFKELAHYFPSGIFDVILTDPPYGVGVKERNGIPYTDNFYDLTVVPRFLFRVLKQDSRAFVFSAQKTYCEVKEAFEKAGFRTHQVLVWYRANLIGRFRKKYDFMSVYENIFLFYKGRARSRKKITIVDNLSNMDVLKYPTPQSNFKVDKRYHVNQKPLKLMEHLVFVASDENHIIFDPFAGAGTTLVAAEKLGRRWVGIEIEKEYCEIAVKRIEDVAQQKPVFKP